jgi:hypothetical protein
MMYIQDFPRLEKPNTNLSQFAKDLIFFIEAQKIPSHVIDKLREYDFQKAEGVGFVHSISGDHIDHVERHGKNGLASAIERLGLKLNQDEILQLCYVVRKPIFDASLLTRQTVNIINVRLRH